MYMCVILREKEGNIFTIALIMNLILKALSIENIPEVKILTKMQLWWMNHLLLTFHVACIEMDVSCSNCQFYLNQEIGKSRVLLDQFKFHFPIKAKVSQVVRICRVCTQADNSIKL